MSSDTAGVEPVAYVVCRHCGLGVELRARQDITLWGVDSKEPSGSLPRISETAEWLVEEVEAAISRGDNQLVAVASVTGTLLGEQRLRQAA